MAGKNIGLIVSSASSGISATKTTATVSTRIYGLGGRLMAQKPLKGVYIENGKKIVR